MLVVVEVGRDARSTATSTTHDDDRRPGPASIGHVFVINLENEDYETTWGPRRPRAISTRRSSRKGKLLTQYYGIGHVSLDNYIAEISGQSPNPSTQGDCVTYTEFAATGTGSTARRSAQGCVYPKSVKTIADQLTAAGKTWRSYQEDMGTPCRHPAIGAADDTVVARKGDMYATRHNPFVYFHSIIDTPACAQNVVDFDTTRDRPDVDRDDPEPRRSSRRTCATTGTTRRASTAQPGGLVSADRFLAAEVPKILASPAYKADGMLVITFDEASITSTAACCHTPPSPNADKPGIGGPGGGRIGTLVISSPSVKAGTTDATPYNHYALLCSIEDIFGSTHLGFAGAPGLACFGKDVYDAP